MAERCRLRIVAFGSPFGADRIAWDAIEALGPLPDGVEAVRCASPLSELPALLRGADAVLLADAMLGVPAGSAVRCTRDELQSRGRQLSSHGLSVAFALDLAAALGELPPRLSIVGLGIGAEAERVTLDLPGAASACAAALRQEIERRCAPRPRRGIVCEEAGA